MLVCIYMYNASISCIFIYVLVPVLQQTVPPGGVAVCPLSTVQYTCVTQNDLHWRASAGSVKTATYTLASQVNDTAMAGVFNTTLTNKSDNTFTSTATIDSVNLTDDGRNISCTDTSVTVFQLVRVEGKQYTKLLEPV